MNSAEALDFAIARLLYDRKRFVHKEQHDAALETLEALRDLVIDQQLELPRQDA